MTPIAPRLMVAMLGLAAIQYTLVVIASGGLFAPSGHGMVFNSMALHLLEGRFDVDPATIRNEGFFRDGRSIAYFGIVPALLRIPLAPFVDLTAVQLEGPYRLAAMLLAGLGGAWLMRGVLARMPPESSLPGFLLLLAVLFSGPAVMVGARLDIFNEVALWSWAIAIWFLALLLPALDPAEPPSAARLAGLAALGGCAVLTRPTIGLGLLIALALLMLALAWRQEGGNPLLRPLRAACRWRFSAPALIAIACLAIAAGVNQARWGNPLTFADMSLQTEMLDLHPDRRARLDTYGLFNLQRLWLGLIYYFLPVWAVSRDGRFLFHDDIARLFDAFELPPSSFFLTDPLTMALAAIGLCAVARQRVPGVARGPAIGVMLGLSVPPALMLVAWYMAFRYRVEFMPLFLLLACCGALRVSDWMAGASATARRLATIAMAPLLVFQVAAAQVIVVLYGLSPWGNSLHLAPEGLPAFYRGLMAAP